MTGLGWLEELLSLSLPLLDPLPLPEPELSDSLEPWEEEGQLVLEVPWVSTVWGGYILILSF